MKKRSEWEELKEELRGMRDRSHAEANAGRRWEYTVCKREAADTLNAVLHLIGRIEKKRGAE